MKLWFAWLAIVTVALAITAAVVIDETMAWELDALREIETWPFPGETLANTLRLLTTTEADLAVGAIVVAGLWLSGSRREAAVFAVLLVILPLVQHGIKVAIDRPRPPYDLDVVWSEPTSPSYPSGHAMSAAVVYGMVLYLALFHWRATALRVVAGGWSLIVLCFIGLSSMYLVVHWPTDTTAGYLFGFSLLLPAIWLARRWSAAEDTPPAGARPPLSWFAKT